ncbi:MAG: HAD family hydrolase [Oscillospiraceae bacterium]|nr:HAD family hydrolase [Oscillospiraceae bacterium]
MKTYKNYLFDLYGTLVDIRTDEHDDLMWTRLSYAFGMEGMDLSAEYLREKYFSEVTALQKKDRAVKGQFAEIDLAHVYKAICRDRGYDVTDRQIEQIAKIFRVLSLHKLCLFDGAVDLLVRLRNAGKGVYLVSNAQELFTMPEFEFFGLEKYFDGIILSSSVGYKKPGTEIYEIALERFGLDPEETVMVGNDDRADCWGAHNAGLDSMYVFTEQSPKLINPLPENCRVLETIGDAF